MTKRVTMTSEESQLFSEVNKLVKRANQRLLRVERATGTRGTFASTELYDHLSSSNLKAVTSGGRISMKKSYYIEQLRSIKTATEKYLRESTSTVKGVKEYRKRISKQAGKELSFEQAAIIYELRTTHEWIYEYYLGSDFWKEYGNPVIKDEMPEGAFKDAIYQDISKEEFAKGVNDEELRQKITNLYLYVKSGEE